MTRRQLWPQAIAPSLAFILCLALAPAAVAQAPAFERKNGVYGEFFGASYLGMTINYDRMLTSRFNVRLGGGFVADDANVTPDLLVMANVVFGKGRHQLTMGIGTQVLFWGTGCANCTGATDWTLASEIGYRYTAKFGLLVKATLGVNAFQGQGFSNKFVFPLPGVSLGWSF